MKASKMNSKSELRRSALEAIKATRRLIDLKKNDPLRAGTYEMARHRLDQLEKQLYKLRRKSRSEAVIEKVTNEVANLIGNFVKSLIRYLLSPCVEWASVHLHYGVEIQERSL